MNHGRFGILTTTLATATSRRAALRGVVAILAGGGAATVADAAAAATACRRGRQTCSRNSQCCSGTCRTGREVPMRDRNRCTCEDGLTLCGNACVETDTDMRNCGACGNICNAGDYCAGGNCRFHQECHSDETGFCYMDLRGKEHRAEGLLFGGDWVPCNADADCADIYDACALPGVDCACVRAGDTGSGYGDAPGDGAGVCVALLDSGDSTITCAAGDHEGCLFTADGNEMLACEDGVISAGDCVDYACDGVGVCDDDGVSCTCALALAGGPYAFYTNAILFGTPTCIAYLTAEGPCPA